jgi:hypothetical protein
MKKRGPFPAGSPLSYARDPGQFPVGVGGTAVGYARYRAWLADVGEAVFLGGKAEFVTIKRRGRPRWSFSKNPPPSKRAEVQRRYRRKLALAKYGNGNSK